MQINKQKMQINKQTNTNKLTNICKYEYFASADQRVQTQLLITAALDEVASVSGHTGGDDDNADNDDDSDDD